MALAMNWRKDFVPVYSQSWKWKKNDQFQKEISCFFVLCVFFSQCVLSLCISRRFLRSPGATLALASGKTKFRTRLWDQKEEEKEQSFGTGSARPRLLIARVAFNEFSLATLYYVAEFSHSSLCLDWLNAPRIAKCAANAPLWITRQNERCLRARTDGASEFPERGEKLFFVGASFSSRRFPSQGLRPIREGAHPSAHFAPPPPYLHACLRSARISRIFQWPGSF